MIQIQYFVFFVLFSFFTNAQKQEIKNNSIIYLYGSSSCHTCIDTKKFLEKENINYIFYDVDTNFEKQREMIDYLRKSNISLKNLNLPAVRMGNQIITNELNFEEFLQNILKLIKK